MKHGLRFTLLLIAFLLVFQIRASGQETKKEPKNSTDSKEVCELHAVGIYEGQTRTGKDIHGGKAKVIVRRPGKNVILLLSSYEPVTWDIASSESTTIGKVILAGYHKQATRGLHSATEVVKAFREAKSKTCLYVGYEINTPSFRNAAKMIAEMTKLDMSSFHGKYRASLKEPFIIDGIQDDDRLLADYPKPTPLKELPKLSFHAVAMLQGRFRRRPTTSYGVFTLEGPVLDSSSTLPAGITKLTKSAGGKVYYGLSQHDVFKVDLKNKKALKMDVGMDVPRLSWPSDLTFDTKRNRLIVSTCHVYSYLYVYDSISMKWNVPFSSRKIKFAAIEYRQKDDMLYCIFAPNTERERPVLGKIDMKGNVIKETILEDPVLPGALYGGLRNSTAQLLSSGKFLVLMIYEITSVLAKRKQLLKIYVLDPENGKAWLASKSG
jgi:hypothetical protein